MKISLITIAVSVSIVGCAIHSGPEDDLEFHQISQLSELEGTYNNQGDPEGYLSSIIWGDVTEADSTISHEDIELIGVSATSTQLFVKAISGGCVVFERQYSVGRDFELDDGTITMSRDTHLLTRGGDDPLLGPSYQRITVGLDTRKHGKYRSKEYAAGLIFMVVPVLISGESNVRFDRMDVDPKEFETCDDGP